MITGPKAIGAFGRLTLASFSLLIAITLESWLRWNLFSAIRAVLHFKSRLAPTTSNAIIAIRSCRCIVTQESRSPSLSRN